MYLPQQVVSFVSGASSCVLLFKLLSVISLLRNLCPHSTLEISHWETGIASNFHISYCDRMYNNYSASITNMSLTPSPLSTLHDTLTCILTLDEITNSPFPLQEPFHWPGNNFRNFTWDPIKEFCFFAVVVSVKMAAPEMALSDQQNLSTQRLLQLAASLRYVNVKTIRKNSMLITTMGIKNNISVKVRGLMMVIIKALLASWQGLNDMLCWKALSPF